MYSEVRNKIMDKYNLYNGQVITVKLINEISYNEKIEIKDIVTLLGLYIGVIYNKNTKTSRINLLKNKTMKENVRIILIDLKYLNKYGSRSYKYDEILQICKKYNVDKYDFIKYFKKNNIAYENNFEILLKNKLGIWIGDKPELSIGFLHENYNYLIKGIYKVLNVFVKKYGHYEMSQDFFDVGYNAILKNGQIEKDYSFDHNRIISKLLFRAKYAMLDYLIEKLKLTNYQENLLLSNETYFERDSLNNWLKGLEFNTLENVLIDEFLRRQDEIFINRNKEFNNIQKKLNITKLEFKSILCNIQKKMVNLSKVRVCSDGRVVILNEES